jgi:hypothetical protein
MVLGWLFKPKSASLALQSTRPSLLACFVQLTNANIMQDQAGLAAIKQQH